MNVNDFSDRFDVLLNSFAYSQLTEGKDKLVGEQKLVHGQTNFSVNLDEYEKSVFLTQAQRNLVIGLYTGKNEYGFSFEEKELVREALDALVTSYITSDSTIDDHQLADGKHEFAFFDIPKDLLYIVWEQVQYKENKCPCKSFKRVPVIPVTHDELHTRLENPFRGPKCRRVLRLNAADNRVELVSDYPIGSYIIRYVKEPQPIVLAPLSWEMNINGVTTPQTSFLPDILHEKILEDAVALAIQSKVIPARGE